MDESAPALAKLLALAKAELARGVREEPLGSNDGPRVRLYHAAAGSRPGDPWCAAMLCWLHKGAGISNVPGAWSPSWFPPGRTVSPEAVQAGDCMGVYFVSKGRVAHVGLVLRVERRTVVTFEGNTNAQGSRDGDRAAQRIRARDGLRFSRWHTLPH